MRFDDTLDTVLSADLTTAFGKQSAWRQIVDLVGRGRVPADRRAIAVLESIRADVPPPVRAASARAIESANPPSALVRLLIRDEFVVALPLLRSARMPVGEWMFILPALSPPARSILRGRRDLPAEVMRGLESFGPVDLVLDDANAPRRVTTRFSESDEAQALFDSATSPDDVASDSPAPESVTLPVEFGDTDGSEVVSMAGMNENEPPLPVDTDASSVDAVDAPQPVATLSGTPFVPFAAIAMGMPVVAEAVRRARAEDDAVGTEMYGDVVAQADATAGGDAPPLPDRDDAMTADAVLDETIDLVDEVRDSQYDALTAAERLDVTVAPEPMVEAAVVDMPLVDVMVPEPVVADPVLTPTDDVPVAAPLLADPTAMGEGVPMPADITEAEVVATLPEDESLRETDATTTPVAVEADPVAAGMNGAAAADDADADDAGAADILPPALTAIVPMLSDDGADTTGDAGPRVVDAGSDDLSGVDVVTAFAPAVAAEEAVEPDAVSPPLALAETVPDGVPAIAGDAIVDTTPPSAALPGADVPETSPEVVSLLDMPVDVTTDPEVDAIAAPAETVQPVTPLVLAGAAMVATGLAVAVTDDRPDIAATTETDVPPEPEAMPDIAAVDKAEPPVETAVLPEPEPVITLADVPETVMTAPVTTDETVLVPDPDPAPDIAALIVPVTPDAIVPAGPFRIADVVARIDAYQRQQDVAPPLPLPMPPMDGFRFETDATGAIRWVEGAARGPMIGLVISASTPGPDAQVDGIAAGAFRRRSRFSNARLRVAGNSDAAGDWLISAVPVFDPASGRFTGYRGTGRRPRVDERAEPPVATAPMRQARDGDALRQLVHELRTPANAIGGFAEMIEAQMLGPVSERYRDRAGDIRESARTLMTVIDDLDLTARIEGGAIELDPRAVALRPLLTGIASDLGPLAALRGCWFALPVDAVSVHGDTRAVERLFQRLMATLASAGGPGEAIAIRAAIDRDGMAVIDMTRPAAMDRYPGDAMLDIDDEGADASLTGAGFALRLVRNLVQQLGGTMVFGAEGLTLRLPAAEIGARGQASLR